MNRCSPATWVSQQSLPTARDDLDSAQRSALDLYVWRDAYRLPKIDH